MSAEPADETGQAGQTGGSLPEPQPEPITQPEPVLEPEPVTELQPLPDREPIPEPESEPVTEPQAEPVTEPQAEPVTEPQAEPVTEPQEEPVTEPQAEPFPELRAVAPHADEPEPEPTDHGTEVDPDDGPVGPVDPAALVDEEGRIDPAVLRSLTEVLREAVGRLEVDGLTGRAGLAEVRGLGALAAVVAAGAQSSIAGYAAQWVRSDHRCPPGPNTVCQATHEGPLDPVELGRLVDKGGEAGEAHLGPVMRLNAGTALGRIRSAVALSTTLARTRELLAAGEIDEARAMIIAGVLHDAAPEVADAVQDVILPTAGQSSRPRLRERVRHARGAADKAWQKRLADRARDRAFIHPSPSDIPGMTSWAALLPTEDSAELEAAIRSAAKRLKTEGFEGTYAQARAEAFLDIALRNVATDVTLDLTVPVETLDETHDQHDHDDNHEPRSQDEPQPDPDAESERGDAGEPDGSAHEPEGEADVEPAVAAEGEDAEGRDASGTVGREPVIPAAFLRPPTGEFLADVQADCDLPEGRGVPVHGLGVIPVHRLRDWLNSLDTSFRRVLIDADTGLPLDVGATRYRPGARLAKLIRLRDGTCRFPFCDARAEVCDLDHVIPHPVGATTPVNLMALCRRHHRLKTHTRWAPVLDPITFEVAWTDPYGQTFLTTPRTTLGDLAVNPDTS